MLHIEKVSDIEPAYKKAVLTNSSLHHIHSVGKHFQLSETDTLKMMVAHLDEMVNVYQKERLDALREEIGLHPTVNWLR